MIAKDTKTYIQLVVFRLQQEEYGLEINNVREVVRISNITHLPSADAIIEGVINLRGQITPVINLSKLLDLQALPEPPKTARIVVAEVDHIVVGMMVDQVLPVLKIAQEDIQSTPELIQQKLNMRFVEGVGKLGDRLIIILNLATLLHPHENTIHALEKEINNG